MTSTYGSEARVGWMLDETANAGRENLDAGHVARYDDKEDADAKAEVEMLTTQGLDGDSIIVDLGAGTGQFTLAAASTEARVIAVDSSPVMLQLLTKKIDASAVPNVEVINAGFLTYQHSGPLADFAYSRYVLHYLPDFWKALALIRVRQLLKPGGIFRLWDVVFSFEPSDAAERIESWCATGGTDVDGDWTRAELEEHVRDEYSTFTWLLEPMMQRAGFEISESQYSADGIFAQYILRAV